MPPGRYCAFLTSGEDGIDMVHTDILCDTWVASDLESRLRLHPQFQKSCHWAIMLWMWKQDNS